MQERVRRILNLILETFEIIGLIILYFSQCIKKINKVNYREFINNTFEVCYCSVASVIITTLSIGMVSSLQLTKHFMAFGATAEIGGTNAIAQMRELAPLITGIVIIGRIGSAWTAEIGSMKMTDQINALKVMKIDLIKFLISPKVFSCMLSMPILNTVSIIASLTGGFLITKSIADTSINSFIDSVHRYIQMYDFSVSTIKAIVFGAIIALISCIYGLRAEGGALGVGKYTTKAVVASLVSLFLVNYLLSLIFYSILK